MSHRLARSPSAVVPGQIAYPHLASYELLPLPLSTPGTALGVYEMAALAYLAGALPALLRFTPSISEWLLGDYFLGASRQLRPPTSSLFAYAR